MDAVQLVLLCLKLINAGSHEEEGGQKRYGFKIHVGYILQILLLRWINMIIFVMNERIEPNLMKDKYALFEDKLTGQSRMFKLELVLHSSTQLNLTLTFQIATPLKDLLHDAQIFYMNPSTQVCQLLGTFPFCEDVIIQIDRRRRDKLYFKFRKIQKERTLPLKSAVGEAIIPSARKSKERTIGQVNHYLQSWKKVYNTPQQSGIPYTLQQAAEKIGLPKKTLDDYERQIRMAKAMNFDFQTNKNGGMGVIRNFVRMQGSTKGQQAKQQILQPQFFLNIGKPANR